jgi:hypothetical protein
MPTDLGVDVWLQLDRRTSRPDSQSSALPPVQNLIKINPTFLELRDDTAKIDSLYNLEMCKNFLVLPIKYAVFFYNVCWKYFHPSKHLAI